jgi:F-type H+-transporting ATPase subunit a
MISTSPFEGILFNIGTLKITGSIVMTWAIMLILAFVAWISTRNMKQAPGNYQVVLEGIVTAMEDSIAQVLPDKVDLVFPFVTTLWIFILVANLVGLVPGLSSPTSDLSVTASLAILVFLSVHWFGVRAEGWKAYLKHYIAPSPILLPFHLISEVSRTLALAVRLFGNVMSLQIAAVLVLMVAGLLVPVPLLMLHIVEAVIQAYLFGVLALIYIAGGIQSQELRNKKEGE